MSNKEVNNKDIKHEGLAGKMDKVDEIREIIFGSNIREYNQEFKEVRENIAATAADIRREMADMKKELLDTITSLRAEMDRKFDSTLKLIEKEVARLSDEKTDRELLGKLLVNVGQKLQEKK